jgi:DNA-directed RNA polymerase subunit RPC12/RpoP
MPGFGEPDTGPHYVSAPPPHYESVGDAGPQYESVPQPQYDEAAGYGQEAAPPQYQPSVEEPAPSQPRKYTCSSCRSQFTIGTPQRPVKVNCPSCRSMMIIRD